MERDLLPTIPSFLNISPLTEKHTYFKNNKLQHRQPLRPNLFGEYYAKIDHVIKNHEKEYKNKHDHLWRSHTKDAITMIYYCDKLLRPS
jgi:hypothetical protein